MISDCVSLLGFDILWHEWVFCFALIAGHASNFCLETKVTKSSRRQRSFGAQASTRLGVLVWTALVPGLLGFVVIEELDGVGAFGLIVDVLGSVTRTVS